MMNESDIRKYAGLMQELGLTGLEITEDNKVVRLERTAPHYGKRDGGGQCCCPGYAGHKGKYG